MFRAAMYSVHCLHLPRCVYYTQCHHSMSSFSPLPYLHYPLHYRHRCIIFLLIFRTLLAFIIIVLTSITAINAIAKVFASIYMFFTFITVSFVSSSVFLLLFFILMGVILIFIIVSIIMGIILEITSCSCLHQFLHFSHIHQFLPFPFFCLPSPLLHHCLHTHGCCPNIHHRFYYTRSHLLLLSSYIYSFHSFHHFLLFVVFCLPSPLLHHCLHTHECCPNIHHRFYCTRSHLLLVSS